MPKLLRVSERHQITLPGAILRDAGVSEGGYLSVEAKDGKIILEPRTLGESELSGRDWEAMDKLVSRQVRGGKFTEYPAPSAAKKHLKRPK